MNLLGRSVLLTLILVNSLSLFSQVPDFIQTDERRIKVINTCEEYIGIKELTGKNDGPEVERFLAYVHVYKPAPWCAAVICENYGKHGVCNPRSAWSPAFFNSKTITNNPQMADTYGIFYPKLKRIGHVGVLLSISADGRWIEGYEGNTNSQGSREGNQFAHRKRLGSQIRMYADWFKLKKCPKEI